MASRVSLAIPNVAAVRVRPVDLAAAVSDSTKEIAR